MRKPSEKEVERLARKLYEAGRKTYEDGIGKKVSRWQDIAPASRLAWLATTRYVLHNFARKIKPAHPTPKKGTRK